MPNQTRDAAPDGASAVASGAREGQLLELLDTLPLLLWTARPDGSVDSCNSRWCDYTGLTREQTLGRGWMAALHPGDLASTEAEVIEAFGQGRTYEIEQRLRRHDGQYRWFLVRGTPVRDASGQVVRWGGANLDIQARKEAEAALADHRLRLALVLEGSEHGAWDWLVGSATLTVNRRWREIAGVKGEGEETVYPSQRWIDAIHPDDAARVIKASVELIAGRLERYDFEYRLRGEDGAWRWVRSCARAVVRQPDRAAVRIAGTLADITERKQAEAKLQESEQFYQDLFHHNRAPKLLVEPETGRIVQANDAACAFYGYSRERLTALCVWDLNLLGEAETRRRMAQAASPAQAEFEVQHRLASGAVRDVRVYSGLVHPGGRALLHSIILDVTEEKRAQAERQVLEGKYRRLFDHLQAGIVVHAPDTSITMANVAACRVLGLSLDQVQGKAALDPAWRFVREDGSPMPLAEYPVNQVVATGTALSHQVVGVDRPSTGDRAWALVHAFPEFGPTGQLVEVVVTFVDITQRKRAEEDRGRLEGQLQQAQKMESVGRLAGGIAHDFNNMLGVILGHAAMALEEVDPALPLHDDLAEIERAAKRSADLTRQLLAFARKQTIKPVALDLNVAVAGMLKLLQRIVGEDIRLTWRPGEGLWPTRVDPLQLDQVLANLCVNARDAIDGVGSLTVETGNVTFDEASCATLPEAVPGDFVRLAVTDSGTGMDKETLSHLFEPFFTTKVMGKGTGLGLATVYGIVKQSEGFIQVDSEPGRGTTFTVYLPRHLAQARVDQADVGVAAAPRGTETVLLVEDQPGMLLVTRRMLDRLGYTVLSAGTPADALRLVEAHPGPIDLLLTDVVMPEMNGPALAERLGALRPGLKRLFMSGYTANVIAHHGVLGEGVHFIQKPFDGPALAAAVRAALD